MSADATSTLSQHSAGVETPPSSTPAPESAPSWPTLSPIERRILGVLVEKQKTSKTADAYPLTLNALATGCNQKSNREPVMDLDEIEVEEGLALLQQKGLVDRVTGGRAERFRHKLYDVWTKNGPELAVLAELLLRGPQTRGDLRGRAARMDPIDTLDALDVILKPLLDRRLVIYLGDPERRGTLVSHGFHAAEELPRLNSHSPALEPDAGSGRTTPSGVVAVLEAKLMAAVVEIDSLKARTAALETALAELKAQLGQSAGTP